MIKDNQMVRLKGVGDSLWITLDPLQPIDAIQKEMDKLFNRMKHLAVNARIIIDTGTKDSKDKSKLIQELGFYLKKKFCVGYVSSPPRQRVANEEIARKRDVQRSWEHHKNNVLMLAGRVRSGQKVAAKNHLLIMGDVNPGAEIQAAGDIIVMGTLKGVAAAGQPENEEAIVAALAFSPSLLKIGGYVAGAPSLQSVGSVEFAHVENGKIIVEDYLEAGFFGKLPWLKVR